MPRTVLYLHTSSGLYGADVQLLTLATRLDRGRFTPLVVLPERGELADLLQAGGVETVLEPLAVLRRRLVTGKGLAPTLAALARNRRELGDLAARRSAAIVHTNTSTVLAGQAVAARAGAVHVQHVREIYSGAGGTPAQLLWPLLRRRLLRADSVLCVSEAVARQFAGSEHVAVVYDGLAPVSQAPREAARAALGLPPGRFVVAVVGRISDWKGQGVLARALAEPALAEIGAIGLVVGEHAPGQAEHSRALLELRDRLGLDDRLRLLGFRRDVETVLGAADAVAVPSTYPDSLPNAALQAGLAGVPVVASGIGGLPEIIRDGTTGRLVPPGDARALAEALRALADDPAGAGRLGAAAADDLADRFGVDRMLDEVQACYERLAR